jgi:hypothetical protein
MGACRMSERCPRGSARLGEREQRMTATTEQTPDLDLDALEADARQKIEDAEDAEARLSLDALSDPEVANALRDVRSERNAAQDQLRQIALARGESDRRTEVAEREAEAKAKAKALREAKALDATLLATARKYDTAAGQLARLAIEHRQAAEQRQQLLHRAGVAEHPWVSGSAIYGGAIVEAWAAHGMAAWAAWPGGKTTSLEAASDHFT